MADEIDLTFLGEQIRRLQVDVRELKAREARTDADVLALNARLDGIEGEMVRRFELVDDQFADMRAELTRNLEIVLRAIQELKE